MIGYKYSNQKHTKIAFTLFCFKAENILDQDTVEVSESQIAITVVNEKP